MVVDVDIDIDVDVPHIKHMANSETNKHRL